MEGPRKVSTVNPHYTDTRYNDKIHYTDDLTITETLSQEATGDQKLCRNIFIQQIWHLLHIILLIKNSLQQQIHFNGKSLRTNVVVETWVHCTKIHMQTNVHNADSRYGGNIVERTVKPNNHHLFMSRNVKKHTFRHVRSLIRIEGKAMIRNRDNYPTPSIRDIKRKETQTRNN